MGFSLHPFATLLPGNKVISSVHMTQAIECEKCGLNNHDESLHDETSFVERRRLVDEFGWEPFQHWFCEPGDLPGEDRSSNTFRNWWQANVGIGGSGVPLWRLKPWKVNKTDIACHINEHLCDVCGKKFTIRKKLTDHINKAHKKAVPCSQCGKLFTTKYGQKRHLQEVHIQQIPQLNCVTCARLFKRTENLKAHQLIFHKRKRADDENENKEEQRKLKGGKRRKRKCGYCIVCNVNFKRREYLKKHQERRHIVRQKSGSFMMFSSAIDKFKNVTPRMITEYICQLCPQRRKYKAKQNLQKHQIVIHKGLRNTMRYRNMFVQLSEEAANKISSRKVSCPYCHKNFSCIQNQQEHIKQEHNQKIYQCIICKKTFSAQKTLTDHKKEYIVKDYLVAAFVNVVSNKSITLKPM